MKNKQKNQSAGITVLKAAIVFTVLLLTGLYLTACGDSGGGIETPSHVHDWGEWTETTPATYLTEGEETRTCETDESHTETRVIPQKAFTDINEFGLFLLDLDPNDKEHPYTIKLNLNVSDFSDIAPLGATLRGTTTRYVSLDLSGSTVTASTGQNIFYECTTLIAITIPNSVTTITSGFFRGCTNLAAITIPNSVTSIGNSVFSGCTSLAGITIPNSVTSIGMSAFENCKSLTSVTIPNGVTELTSTFSGCSSLASITIPNSVTVIKSAAFSGCSSLASVTFQRNGLTNIGSANVFPGDLVFVSGGEGDINRFGKYTTTNPSNSSTWKRQ